jgi:lipoprotein-anchoring transpeptidase ErfK/SrfK
MNRAAFRLLIAGVSLCAVSAAASAEPLGIHPGYESPAAPEPALVQRVSARGEMGGGFIEFLFGGNNNAPPQQPYFQPAPPPGAMMQEPEPEAVQPPYQPAYRQQAALPPADTHPPIQPQFLKHVVRYTGAEKPGTIIIDTRLKFLFLIQDDGTALRYGVGVGKPGFLWAGVKSVTRKREWPDWTPPAEMLQRRPDLPRHMEGGIENPLGARALYLGSSLYRIHGSNEPWTIGTNVSSGCIRMRNEDVIDLYNRVPVGTKVVVI